MKILLSPYLLPALLAALLVMFGWLLILSLSLRRYGHDYKRITEAIQKGDFASVIKRYHEDLGSIKKELTKLTEHHQQQQALLSKAVQKVGLVRFDAFDDVGGELSFSAALLNEDGDGLVISSIYGRGESRSYAKPVKGKKSSYALSAEEKEAISNAFK